MTQSDRSRATDVSFRLLTEPQQGTCHAALVDIALHAEGAGFEALFRSDHYMRVGSGSGLPGPSDAWVTLAALAVQTRSIRLGTLVSPVTFRPPASLALIVAQVDHMSGGRVELGLGAGWYAGEHAAFGLPFPELPERHRRLDEYARLLLGLWADDSSAGRDFVGRYYTLADSPGLPKPVQRPHPPLILGGAGGPKSVRMAADWATEYNIGFPSSEKAAQVVAALDRATKARGRSVISSVALTLCIGRDETELRMRAARLNRSIEDLRLAGVAGRPDEAQATIARFVEAGIRRFYLQVHDLHDLDQLDLFVKEVAPAIIERFGAADFTSGVPETP